MRRTLALALSLLLFSASLAFAQAVTSGTGAINGRVTDASGAVMPGVTVTITAPQQMGARTAVSDSDGSYRFTAVTPGDYTVVFELAGFSTIRNEGIRVSLGFTASVSCAPTARGRRTPTASSTCTSTRPPPRSPPSRTPRSST